MEILKSKKFLTGLAASLINAVLVALGVPVEVALAVTSPLSASLLAQGVVDVRKAGPTAGAAAALVIAAGLLGAAGVGLSGCATVRRASSSFVDCMAPNTRALAGELQGVVADVIRGATDTSGRVDWSSVKASVRSFRSDAPLCAFQTAVREMLLAGRRASSGAPQSAGLEYSEDDLRAGYAEVNAEVFGARLAPL